MTTAPRTRRPKGEGSIDRHHRPGCTREPSCRCGYRARLTVVVNGRTVRKTIYAPTEKGIVRAKKKLLAEEVAGTVRTQRSVTLADWMESWLESAELTLNTRKGYRSKINSYITPYLGQVRLDRLQPEQVEDMYKAMRQQGLAESTCRQTHAILHRALRMAVMRRRLALNPCDMLVPPKTGSNPRTGLTVSDAWKVLRVCGDDPRFWIALWCGLRQGEALALRWGDVYLDDSEAYLVVRRSVAWGSDGPVFGTPKSKASTDRIVPLPTPVAVRLRIVRAQAASVGRGVDDLVFPGSTGQPLQAHRDWMHWATTLKLAGVEHVALHAARNTTAQLLENAGAQPRQVAAILGHSTVDMTHHYQSGNLAAAVDSMKALETYMSKMEGTSS